MTDWRYQGQGMRRRMGAPSSHLEAANAQMSPDGLHKMDPESIAHRVRQHNELTMPGYGPDYWGEKYKSRRAEAFTKQANIPKVPYWQEDADADMASGKKRAVWGPYKRYSPNPDLVQHSLEPAPAHESSPACGYHSVLGRPCTCKR